MQPEGGHDYRPPIAVVAGVVDGPDAGSDIDSAAKACRVIRLDDLVPPEVEPSECRRVFPARRCGLRSVPPLALRSKLGLQCSDVGRA
jgi:hypothetical protein